MESIDLPYVHDEWQIQYAEKKLALIHQPLSRREIIDIRARGGSKTFDMMMLALYLASLGAVVKWFCAVASQMKQPKKYMAKIINSSYIKFLLGPGEPLKESVRFMNEGEVEIINLTEDNARSPRGDVAIYDEMARADEDAYNAGVNILSNTDIRISIYISTALKGSLFEKAKNKLKRREVLHNEQYVFERKWYEISFLEKNREWYEEERARLKKEGKEYLFRQEHECSFELPTGAIFKNLVFEVFDENGNLIPDIVLDRKLKVSGLDWNPVAGHWLVGGKWTLDRTGFVITQSNPIAIGYTHQLKEEAYINIKKYCTYGNKLCAEKGGINNEYYDWFLGRLGKDPNKKNISLLWEEWDSAGVNKTNACLSMEAVTIYVDEILFPTAKEQLENAHWKEDAFKAEVEKDRVDSPHAFDAFLHAINKKLLKEGGIRRFDWYGNS